MFSLTVSDHIMVAHSFKGQAFGPAQRVHGATFVVEAEFRAPRLDRANLLVDIALARTELRRTLDGLDYRNLDDVPELTGRNTTTEFLCALVHGMLVAAIHDGRLGEGAGAVTALKVTLRESPLAWASYEAPLPGRPGAGESAAGAATGRPAEAGAPSIPARSTSAAGAQASDTQVPGGPSPGPSLPGASFPAGDAPAGQPPGVPTEAEMAAMLRALMGPGPSGSLP